MDRSTNRRKGFVFIIFKSEDSVEDVLKLPSHSIEGREVIYSLKILSKVFS